MTRIHRSIVRRAEKIDPGKIADDAEEYLDAYSMNKRQLDTVAGLISTVRIKKSVKKIDELEREIGRMEDKIDRLMEKRAIEAVKLEEALFENKDILKDYMSFDRMRDFRE